VSELVSLVQLVGCLLADWATVVHCLAGQEIFLLSKATRLVVGPTPPQNLWETPQVERGWAMKLATHLHLLPRLGMCGAVLPLPHILRGKFC